jgi:membrane protease YdiL (CAAX protease family)
MTDELEHTPISGDDVAVREELASELDPAPPDLGARAWPAWSAPLALIAGFVMAAVGGLLIDLPLAVIFGVDVTSSKLPGGVTVADTVVQEGAFVLAAVIFAQMGGRTVRAWQFGLRPPRVRRLWTVLLAAGIFIGFLLFTAVWAKALDINTKEKLLEELGTGESAILLLASAALTCVVAPICEEFLFRGFFFRALCNWRGPWPAAVITGLVFGGAHATSAPLVDLVPLAVLGFGLCLLYRWSGSLYPCIVVHALNNSLAFGGLENWNWQQTVLLMVCSLGIIALLGVTLRRVGVISPARS